MMLHCYVFVRVREGKENLYLAGEPSVVWWRRNSSLGTYQNVVLATRRKSLLLLLPLLFGDHICLKSIITATCSFFLEVLPVLLNSLEAKLIFQNSRYYYFASESSLGHWSNFQLLLHPIHRIPLLVCLKIQLFVSSQLKLHESSILKWWLVFL